MAGTDLVAPTLDELTYALKSMTPDRLRSLMQSYVDNARASGQPIIDARAIVPRVPPGHYLLKVRKHVPECKLISETGRLCKIEEALAITWLLSIVLTIPAGLLIFYLFPAIIDFVPIAASCWGGIIAVTFAAFATIHFVRRQQDRIVCPIPVELHKTLMAVLFEIREKRRSWMGISLVVKLVGQVTFDPIAHGVAGEHIGDFLGKLMETISDKALETHIEKHSEQLREEILARFPPPVISVGTRPLNLLEQYSKIIEQRTNFAKAMRGPPPYAATSGHVPAWWAVNRDTQHR